MQRNHRRMQVFSPGSGRNPWKQGITQPRLSILLGESHGLKEPASGSQSIVLAVSVMTKVTEAYSHARNWKNPKVMNIKARSRYKCYRAKNLRKRGDGKKWKWVGKRVKWKVFWSKRAGSRNSSPGFLLHTVKSHAWGGVWRVVQYSGYSP